MLVVLLLAGAPILFGERARATEQAIVPLTPPGEQQVAPIGPAASGQVVQGVAPSQEQGIGPVEPPTENEKAASTAGKVTIGVLAAVVSMAAMAAQLLLL